MKRFYLLVLITLLLSACGSIKPVPEDRFYRLAEIPAQEPLAQPLLPGVLAVGTIETPGIYSERAILYSEQDRPTELLRYHYHAWIDAPPRLIQDHLALFLRGAAVAPTVVIDNGQAEWNYLLTGRLRRFEREMDGTGSSVAVAIEYRLLERGGSQPLWVKDYTAQEPVSGETVNDAVQAFSAALNRIDTELLADLKEHASQPASDIRGQSSPVAE
jgi:ABC-type uncharacterized transport system auxiliary subunit